MKIAEKIKILAEAAKYDESCSLSGSSRKAATYGIGNAAMSWAADGRYVSLFKILMFNDYVYDCSYCLSPRSNIS